MEVAARCVVAAAAALTAAEVPAAVVLIRVRPGAARREPTAMVEPAHGVHVAFPAAGARGEGRPDATARKAPSVVTVGRTGLPRDAPGGAARVVPEARPEPAAR